MCGGTSIRSSETTEPIHASARTSRLRQRRTASDGDGGNVLVFGAVVDDNRESVSCNTAINVLFLRQSTRRRLIRAPRTDDRAADPARRDVGRCAVLAVPSGDATLAAVRTRSTREVSGWDRRPDQRIGRYARRHARDRHRRDRRCPLVVRAIARRHAGPRPARRFPRVRHHRPHRDGHPAGSRRPLGLCHAGDLAITRLASITTSAGAESRPKACASRSPPIRPVLRRACSSPA